MYIDPHVLNRRAESDDPSIIRSALDSRSADIDDSPSHISIRSLESSHPLISTDTSAAAETIPTTAALHARKQPFLISSHIGIFLSAIVGLCACLIFLYWLHGCFKVGSPTRPRILTGTNTASLRPGILDRLRQYLSGARAEGKRKLTTKRAKEKTRPCGCHRQARPSENAPPLRDAGPAVELRNYGALGGTGGTGVLNMPPLVLGGAHVREPSYHWDSTFSSRYSDNMGCPSYRIPGIDYRNLDLTDGITQQNILTALTMPERSQNGLAQQSFLGALAMPERSFMRSGRRGMGGRPEDDTYFRERTRVCSTQSALSLFADDGLRTPPPSYEEMCRDGSRRAF